MGLSDYQNAKKNVFFHWYISCLLIYMLLKVDELREQAIHTYKAGQTQQAILQLDQLLK